MCNEAYYPEFAQRIERMPAVEQKRKLKPCSIFK